MARNWKPSKAAAAAYYQEKEALDKFLAENPQIRSSTNRESFYFTIGDTDYRVSNHTIAASDRGMFDELGNQLRDSYHGDSSADLVCITAAPIRLPKIYSNLIAGKKLNKRGKEI